MAASPLSHNAKKVIHFLQTTDQDSIVATDIAASCDLKLPSVLGLLRSLEKRGLISRHDVIGYTEKVLMLTPAGKEINVD